MRPTNALVGTIFFQLCSAVFAEDEKDKACTEDLRVEISSWRKELAECRSQTQVPAWVFAILSMKQTVTEHFRL